MRLLGAQLFEGDEASARLRGRSVFGHQDSDDLFARRLAEARAFGRASESLAASRPDLSAKTGLTAAQHVVAGLLVAAFITCLVLDWQTTLAACGYALGLIFSLIIMLRLAAALSAMTKRSKGATSRAPNARLWTLTILVPLLKEGPEVVRGLLNAIAQLDYPVGKLDVKILVEADDDMTISAVLAAQPPPWFEIIPVPPGQPRTKPKALNYGLATARGRVVAVFDAEDRPSPDQPRAAMAAFQSNPRSLAVVQAPLLIHNGKDGWLAKQFEIEYAIHFTVWLPFLARLGLPLALGGTSNYFCRRRLEQAGGWDAWNVTEDADIGLRLARFGGGAVMINEPTYEEAPSRIKPWMSQRTRWMKGHLQTWLVLMRKPFSAAQEMGGFEFAATQVTFGGALLASIMHAPLFIWIFASVLLFRNFEAWHVALFSVGYGSVLAAALAAKARHARLSTLLTLPFYWPLQSIAMVRAMFEMLHNPHFWAKTPHGVAKPTPSSEITPVPVQHPDNVFQLEFPFEQNRAIWSRD